MMAFKRLISLLLKNIFPSTPQLQQKLMGGLSFYTEWEEVGIRMGL